MPCAQHIPISEYVKIREFREGASGDPKPEPTAPVSDSLIALQQLHDSGVVNDAEHEAKRTELVAKL